MWIKDQIVPKGQPIWREHSNLAAKNGSIIYVIFSFVWYFKAFSLTFSSQLVSVWILSYAAGQKNLCFSWLGNATCSGLNRKWLWTWKLSSFVRSFFLCCQYLGSTLCDLKVKLQTYLFDFKLHIKFFHKKKSSSHSFIITRSLVYKLLKQGVAKFSYSRFTIHKNKLSSFSSSSWCCHGSSNGGANHWIPRSILPFRQRWRWWSVSLSLSYL